MSRITLQGTHFRFHLTKNLRNFGDFEAKAHDVAIVMPASAVQTVRDVVKPSKW
jgi:hypothetical protein